MFKKINKEINSFLKNNNLNKPKERQNIEDCWEKNINRNIRKNTTVLNYKNGVLTIKAKNPTWKAELAMLKEKLKKKLTKTQKQK